MNLLPLSLLGGLVGLDGTSFGQFMASRPIVAATAAGWVLGDAVGGLLIGTLLELMHLSVLAVGGARFPEVGPAAVVAVATAAAGPGPGGIALGCMMALVWGQIGSVSIVMMRRVNGRIAPDPFEGPVDPLATEFAHLKALALDFLRGTVLTTVGVLVGTALVAPSARDWPLGEGATLALLLGGAGLAAGALLRTLGGVRKRGVLFALSALVGLVAGFLL